MKNPAILNEGSIEKIFRDTLLSHTNKTAKINIYDRYYKLVQNWYGGCDALIFRSSFFNQIPGSFFHSASGKDGCR